MRANDPPPSTSFDSPWNVPRPERLPAPSMVPFTMALAITFLFWGLIADHLIAVTGIILLALSLGKWIGEIRDERR